MTMLEALLIIVFIVFAVWFVSEFWWIILVAAILVLAVSLASRKGPHEP